MIELNADIGEGCDDASLMPYLTRVSIACGGHAGDAVSMTAALRLAAEHGVAAGAHPSYPDRAQFGRQALAASEDEIAAWVMQQTEVLAEQAARLGLRLAHVKPHGALYNVAAGAGRGGPGQAPAGGGHPTRPGRGG
ncbi:MAG: LamB/YcsF family protein, partial [Thiobacillus sp.]|nr:LamB/YcsF family protein [Thiobacillus sp.]